jgi:hypothetical protein
VVVDGRPLNYVHRGRSPEVLGWPACEDRVRRDPQRRRFRPGKVRSVQPRIVVAHLFAREPVARSRSA